MTLTRMWMVTITAMMVFQFLGQIVTATDGENAPSQEAIEMHHSLHRPLDQSQVYWNFGGSTVLTKNSIRLTPSAQNRRGWLWNDCKLRLITLV